MGPPILYLSPEVAILSGGRSRQNHSKGEEKHEEKVLPLLMALALCLGLLPAALAANDDFVIQNGVLLANNGPGGHVTIPSTVTEIRGFAGYILLRGLHQPHRCDPARERGGHGA